MSFEKKKSGYNERCKYAKIPIKTKVKFLRKVLIDGLSIKDVTVDEFSHLPSSTSTIPLLRP